MKKILILGGTGFIGYHLTKYLSLNENNKITIADNQFRGKIDSEINQLLKNKNISIINSDFTKASSFNKLDEDYDQVYMLASVVGVNNTLEIPDKIIKINTLLIINTLEWIKKSKVKKVLFTSTSENYAGTIEKFNYKIPTNEDVPLCIDDISHPRFTYAVTKILGESAFLNYSSVYNFDCVVIRYHNVYGPRMGFKHVIPHLVERYLKKENPFLIYGHDQTRSFCYVDDAVIGTVQAMESSKSSGNIFHLGTEDEVSIEKLVKTVGLFYNFDGNYKNAKTFPGSTRRRCPDISKSKKILNYTPKVSLVDGLEKTINWYNNFFNSGAKTFESSFKRPN